MSTIRYDSERQWLIFSQDCIRNCRTSHGEMYYVELPQKTAVQISESLNERKNDRNREVKVADILQRFPNPFFSKEPTEQQKDEQLLQGQLRQKLSKYYYTFNEFPKAVGLAEEIEKLKVRCEAARSMEEKERSVCEQVREMDRFFDTDVEPAIQVFRTVMPDLACFAGCIDEKAVISLEAVLKNRKNHLRWYFQTHPMQEQYDARLPEMPRKDSEWWTEQASGGIGDAAEPDKTAGCGQLMSDVKDMGHELHDVLNHKEGFSRDTGEELVGKCGELEKKIVDSPYGFLYGKGKLTLKTLQEERDEYRRQLENLDEETKTLRSETKMIQGYLYPRLKNWDYVRLLNRVIPLICEVLDPVSDTWASGEYQRFADSLERILHIRPEEFQMVRFDWVFPYSEKARLSERIRLDFQSAEASWPGLYGHTPDENGELFCIIQGGVETE